MSAPRLVDPVHFFNSRGVSVLTAEFQGQRIRQLEEELEKTKRQRDAAVKRLRDLGQLEATP